MIENLKFPNMPNDRENVKKLKNVLFLILHKNVFSYILFARNEYVKV